MFNFIRKLDCFIVRLLGRHISRRICTPEIDLRAIRKILCIKLWGLGNLVLIDPLLYKIRERFPEAHIIFVTFDRNRGFLENNKSLDNIIYFKFTTSLFGIVRQFISLVRRVRAARADLVINFETYNNFSAYFCYLTKAFIRIGLNNKFEKAFYTHPVDNDPEKHISEIFKGLLSPLGIDAAYHYSSFPVRSKEMDDVDVLLKRAGVERFVCIHPGTSENFPGKRLPLEYFSTLIDLIIDKHDIFVVLTGASGEREAIQYIIRSVRNKKKVLSLAGRLSVWQLLELLRKTHVFISGDTGPMHIAASLKVNMAVIYGPTSPQRFRPLHENSLVFYRGVPCSPCVGVGYVNKGCGNDFRCLSVSSQDILRAVSTMFFSDGSSCAKKLTF